MKGKLGISRFAGKMLSVLLAVCMMVTLIPVSSVSAGDHSLRHSQITDRVSSITLFYDDLSFEEVKAYAETVYDADKDNRFIYGYDSATSLYYGVSYSSVMDWSTRPVSYTLEDLNSDIDNYVSTENFYVIGTYEGPIPIEGCVYISGLPQVGRTLTATYSGGNSDKVGDNIAYQWYSYIAGNGPETATPISYATSRTFTPTTGFIGYVLYAYVSGTGMYGDTPIRSDETDPITDFVPTQWNKIPTGTICLYATNESNQLSSDAAIAYANTKITDYSKDPRVVYGYNISTDKYNVVTLHAADSWSGDQCTISQINTMAASESNEVYVIGTYTPASWNKIDKYPTSITPDSDALSVDQAKAIAEKKIVGSGYEHVIYADYEGNFRYLRYINGEYNQSFSMDLSSVQNGYSNIGTSVDSYYYVIGTYTYLTNITGTVSVSGTPKVGYTLTATYTDGNATTEGTDYEYEWYRGTNMIDIVQIPGATSSTYTLTEDDMGKKVYARVAGKGAYRLGQSSISTETITDALRGTVTISGLAQVGNTLTANSSDIDLTTATVTYQWYRNNDTVTGTAISGATGRSYRLTSADKDCKVFVKITGTGDYYGELESAETAKVVSPSPAPTPEPTPTPEPEPTPTPELTPASEPEDNSITEEVIKRNSYDLNKKINASQTGKQLDVSWGEVEGADGYFVYANYCSSKLGKRVKTITDSTTTSATIKKIGGKALDTTKNFKLRIKAYKLVDGKKVAFGKSIVVHVAGCNSKNATNIKKIKLVSDSKVTLTAGSTSQVEATVVLSDKTKKAFSQKHVKNFRYASSDEQIATVDENGLISSVAPGTCSISIYTQNGKTKQVKVVVK